MIVRLENIGKRYRRWVIRDCSIELMGPHHFGISGGNGSGKSTLLKIISGYLSPSEGKVSFWDSEVQLETDQIYRTVSFYGPYSQGIEELTLLEHLRFHQQFRQMGDYNSPSDFFNEVGLEHAKEEYLKNLSSGMAQRFLLGLTLLSKGSLYLFDEPCSFLDLKGKAWFDNMRKKHLSNQLIVVASNQADVLSQCDTLIQVQDFS